MTQDASNASIPGVVSDLFSAATLGPAEYAKTLPEQLSPDERRTLLLAEARRQGLATLSLLPKWWRPEWENENAKALFVGFIEARFAGREDMTVGEVLRRSADLLPWDKFLVDFVEKVPEAGQTIGVADAVLSGGAARLPFADRILGVPVVVAWATRFSPRTSVRKEFSDKIIEVFGKVRGRDAKRLLTAARYVRLRAGGMTHEEIAELLTEEAFVGRPEWEDKKLGPWLPGFR